MASRPGRPAGGPHHCTRASPGLTGVLARTQSGAGWGWRTPQRACPGNARAWQCAYPGNGGRATFLCTGPRRCPCTRRLERRFSVGERHGFEWIGRLGEQRTGVSPTQADGRLDGAGSNLGTGARSSSPDSPALGPRGWPGSNPGSEASARPYQRPVREREGRAAISRCELLHLHCTVSCLCN